MKVNVFKGFVIFLNKVLSCEPTKIGPFLLSEHFYGPTRYLKSMDDLQKWLFWAYSDGLNLKDFKFGYSKSKKTNNFKVFRYLI